MLPLTAFHLDRGQCLVHVNYSQSSPMHRFSDMSSCNALYFMKNKVSLINTSLVHFLAFFFFDFSASSWAFLLAASLLACKRRMNAVKYFRGQWALGVNTGLECTLHIQATQYCLTFSASDKTCDNENNGSIVKNVKCSLCTWLH